MKQDIGIRMAFQSPVMRNLNSTEKQFSAGFRRSKRMNIVAEAGAEFGIFDFRLATFDCVRSHVSSVFWLRQGTSPFPTVFCLLSSVFLNQSFGQSNILRARDLDVGGVAGNNLDFAS